MFDRLIVQSGNRGASDPPGDLDTGAGRMTAVLGGSSTGPVLGTLTWLAGLLAIFVPLSVRRYGAVE